MKLLQNIIFGLRYRHLTWAESITFFMYRVSVHLGFAQAFFNRIYTNTANSEFKKKWLRRDNGQSCFRFGDAKLPDISGDIEKLNTLRYIFEDVFMIPCYYGDNYRKSSMLDPYMQEGPYGYKDDKMDVSVKKGDIVIDAGAWIGDFSAYAASKGAEAYAFEPTGETFKLLKHTAVLNDGNIHPVNKGLGDKDEKLEISISNVTSGANSFVFSRSVSTETISITTLDKFVEENNITKIDFIKADIEGAERSMLKGAAQTLKKLAPKLAICTYHLPDDPQVLEELILQANPRYTVVHLRHKLFAQVVE